jgi:phosphohistidine swiveling domain-containing protein
MLFVICYLNNAMIDLTKFKYFGEWNGILLFDSNVWYHPQVISGLMDYFGEKRSAVNFIINEKQYLFLGKTGLNSLEELVNTSAPPKLLKNLQKFYPVFNEVHKSLISFQNQEYTKFTNQELGDKFMEVIKLLQQITPFDQHCMVGEEFYLKNLEQYLKQQLKELGQEDKFNEYRAVLTSPLLSTSTQQEELSLVEIALLKKQGKDVNQALTDHVLNFGWLPVFLVGPAWDKEYFKKEVAKLEKKSTEELKKQRQEILDFPANTKEKIEEIMGRFSEASLWPRLMQEVAFIRNESETMVSLASFVLKPIFSQIEKHTSLAKKDLRLLTAPEIRKVLVEGVDMSKDIAQREQGVLYYSDRDGFEIEEGESVKDKFRSIYKRPEQTLGESLAGTAASIGKARGTVKILKNVADIQQFKSGEILVSESTCIDYLPAMRLAAAIVTELGGITSHAAIVSRELKIPCIVGVPNVHLTLRTGMQVEVNANDGTIKVI